jgi:hypothetical protein
MVIALLMQPEGRTAAKVQQRDWPDEQPGARRLSRAEEDG